MHSNKKALNEYGTYKSVAAALRDEVVSRVYDKCEGPERRARYWSCVHLYVFDNPNSMYDIETIIDKLDRLRFLLPLQQEEKAKE